MRLYRLGRLGTVEAEQGFADGLGDKAADISFAVKLHFAFGGMDVHVHFAGMDFKEEAADGVAAFHQGSVVAFEQGVVESAVLDWPAIHKEVLVLSCAARNAGRADQSPDAEGGKLRVEG